MSNQEQFTRTTANAATTAETHPNLEGTIYTAAEEIEKAGGRALPLVVDVREEAVVEAAVQQAEGGENHAADLDAVYQHGAGVVALPTSRKCALGSP